MFSRNRGKGRPVKTSNMLGPAASRRTRSFGQDWRLRRVLCKLSRCSWVVISLSTFTLAVLLLLPFLASAAQKTSRDRATKAESADSTSVQRGKKFFTSYGCYECHGRAAQGGTGPRLGPDSIPFAVFLQFVRHPPAKMPTMPPFTAKVASDQDLKDIYAFLSSLPEPPNWKNIPLLKP